MEAERSAENDRPRCDHICLLDEGHVERGEPHFYGYELPSPRYRGRSDSIASAIQSARSSSSNEQSRYSPSTSSQTRQTTTASVVKRRLGIGFLQSLVALLDLLVERCSDYVADRTPLQPGQLTDGDEQVLVGGGGCTDSEGHVSSVSPVSSGSPEHNDGSER